MVSLEAIIALIALLVACIPLCSALLRYLHSRSTNTHRISQSQVPQLRQLMARSVPGPLLPFHTRTSASISIPLHWQQQVSVASFTHNTTYVPSDNNTVWHIRKCDELEL